MNRTLILSFGGVFAMLMVSSAFLMLRQMKQQERFAARVRAIHGQRPLGAPGAIESRAMWAALLRTVSNFGQFILRSGLLSEKTRTDLESTLTNAGYNAANGLAMFVGAKIVLALGLPVVALGALHNVNLPGMLGFAVPLGAGVIGLILPDWLISRQRKRHQAALEGGLPDALDMMVICAQAGLGLGATIVRVSVELQNARWEVALELAQTANELQVLSDSRIALTNLGLRTGVENYKRLGATLVQTMQYGTPLTDSLRLLAAEMRQDMLTRFETRAARLPVLLTLPTTLFILPCLFLIAAGPAIIQVMRAFA
jgi:tight adherence protein C